MSKETEPTALIAGHKPCYMQLRAGHRYLWCRCGRSTQQPFCDGKSHIGTGFLPVAYTAKRDGEEVLFCLCKRTGTPPFCDGTHSNLPGGYEDDEVETLENSTKPWAQEDAEGIRVLDAPCYTIRAAATRPVDPGPFWLRKLVDGSRGAVYQTQFYAEIRQRASPILSAGPDAQSFLFVNEGSGAVEIGNRRFQIGPIDGVLVLAGETFRISPEAGVTLKVFISVCPAVTELRSAPSMAPFDASRPERVARVDPERRKAMGPRFFQHLVDVSMGAIDTTQFIGHIPQSKAAMHRHLYEEALIIVSGRGVIWNETTRAEVAPGDVIFFPRKHLHSLQCTASEGMDVVGVIHPGDNPGINY